MLVVLSSYLSGMTPIQGLVCWSVERLALACSPFSFDLRYENKFVVLPA